MKETEDQRIADKFRQVFENFEDPASNEGWLELRKKYPEEKRRPLFFWISSAAVLILFSGLWIYIPEIKQELNTGKNRTAIDAEKTETQPGSSEPQLTIPAPVPSKLIEKELKLSSDSEPAIILKSAFPEEEKVLINRSSDYSKISDGLTIAAKDSASN
ncbi:MAG: hypothetical protein WC220_14150, partial [Pedobacter sp.]